MGYLITTIAIIGVLMMLLLAFTRMPAGDIANLIRRLGPLVVCLLGLGLIAVRATGFGLPVLMIGILMWAKNRSVGNIGGAGPKTSTVRSAWLEMHLDHDTGDLEGLVLTGELEGNWLSTMSDEDVLALYQAVQDDDESAALMEAYLDRRMPSWREDPQSGPSAGERPSSRTGAMTKEEAHQILGLEPGADADAIRSAHRKLMKAVHPDSGGSTFLAARINEAKDTLLD